MSTKAHVSELTDHLGYWLRLVSNHVSLAFARRLEAEGVTVAEWVVLRVLFEFDHLAPSRLAARMGMTRGAISKLADRLVAKGLVERTDSSLDRRAHTLLLSARARHLVPRLATLADANDRNAFGVLNAAECAALLAVLKKLVAHHNLTHAPLS